MQYLQQYQTVPAEHTRTLLQIEPAHVRVLADPLQLQLFCYMYIRQLPEAYLCMGFFGLGLVLIFYAVRQLRRSMALRKMNDIVKLTYISMVASVISTHGLDNSVPDQSRPVRGRVLGRIRRAVAVVLVGAVPHRLQIRVRSRLHPQLPTAHHHPARARQLVHPSSTYT